MAIAPRLISALRGQTGLAGETSNISIGEYLNKIPVEESINSTNHGGGGTQTSAQQAGNQARANRRPIEEIILYGVVSGPNAGDSVKSTSYHFYVLQDGTIVNKSPLEFTEDGKISSELSGVFFNPLGDKGWHDGKAGLGRPRGGGTRRHQGLDIFGPRGAPVYAAASGTIEYSNFRGGNAGNGVHIKHAGGVNTKYFHLDRLAGLQKGDSVVAGQLIGYNGSSGNADAGAEHVHFEVRKDGVVQEPLDYIEGNKKILNGFSDSVISIGLMLPITPKTIGSKETSGLDELITELIKSIPSITSVSEGDPGGAGISDYIGSRQVSWFGYNLDAD